jgi:hypothetical protein
LTPDVSPDGYTPPERRTPPGTWTPERVIAAIRDWVEEFGDPPLSYEWAMAAARNAGHENGRVQRWAAEYPRWPGTRPVIRCFGSWSAALEAAGLRDGRMAPWDLDLAERVAVAPRLDRAGLKAAEIAELLDVKPQTVRNYLRASACPVCGGPVVHRGSRRCQGCAAKRAHRPVWTREEIIAAFKEWHSEHGAPPLLEDWKPGADRSRQWRREYPRWPGVAQVQGAFGGWSAALEAAGLGVRKPAWDRESVLAAFREFAERNDRSPNTAELREADNGLPMPETIGRHFGSLDALRAELGLEAPARRRRRQWLPPVNQRWDREKIVDAIQAFAAERGRPPTSKDWKRTGDGHPDWSAVARHFGSFGAALSAAGFTPPRISWSREEVIAAINAHLREHGELPKAGDWSKRDPDGKRPALHNIQALFGNWENAIEAAGHPVERWNQESILDALRELGRQLGRRPKRSDFVPKRPGLPGYNTIAKQLGSLPAAFEAAGFANPREWTQEEVTQALLAWAAERGRAPTYNDWRRVSEEHPGVSTVEKLFGSWTEGLLAAGLPIAKRNWNREAILAALRTWAAEHGRAPRSAEWHGADPTGRRPATFRVQREFGTWAAALRAAGSGHTCPKHRSDPKYSDVSLHRC